MTGSVVQLLVDNSYEACVDGQADLNGRIAAFKSNVQAGSATLASYAFLRIFHAQAIPYEHPNVPDGSDFNTQTLHFLITAGVTSACKFSFSPGTVTGCFRKTCVESPT